MQELEDRMASPRMTQHQSPHHGGMLPQLSEEEKMLYAAAAQASRFDRLAAAAGGGTDRGAAGVGVGGAAGNVNSDASTTFNPATAAYGANGMNGMANPAAAGLGASLKQPFGAGAAGGMGMGMGGLGLNGLPNRFAGLSGAAAGGIGMPMPPGVPGLTQTTPQDENAAAGAQIRDMHEAAASRAAHARAAAYAAYAEAELAYREAMMAASVGDHMVRNSQQQQQGVGGHDPSSAAAAVLALSGGGAGAAAAGGKGGAGAGRSSVPGAGMGFPYPTDPSQSALGASDPAMAAAALLQPLGANEGPRRISASSASRPAESSMSSNGASMSNSPHLRASMEPTPLPAQGVAPAAAAAAPKKKKQTRQVKPGGKKRGRKPGSKNKPKPIDPLADVNGGKRKRRKKRTKKPKDMPKRPLSAYNIYFREQRTKILEAIPTPAGYGEDDNKNNGDESRQDANNKPNKHVQEIEIEVIPAACLGGEPRSLRFSRPHGKISFQELAKIIGGNWRTMGEAERSIYKNLAAQDSLRYKQEMEEWHRANDGAGGGQQTPSAAIAGGGAAASLAGLGGDQAGDGNSTESSDIEYHSAAEDGGVPARKKQRQLVKLVKNA